MTPIYDFAIQSIQDAPRFMLDMAFKSMLVFLVAGILVLLLRRCSPAARHFVWLLAVVGALALPLLLVSLPAWPIAVPLPWAEPVVMLRDMAPPAPASVAELPKVIDAQPEPFVLPNNSTGEPAAAADRGSTVAEALNSAPAPALSTSTWLLLIWIGGIMVALWPLTVGLVNTRRLRRLSSPLVEGPAPGLLRALSADLGLKRKVALLQYQRGILPMTWGIIRPIILLPPEGTQWAADRLRVVLLHELAHVRRLDCATLVLAQFVRALYWFNPFAWLALRRLRLEQERACDDLVLGSGARATDYAHSLLTILAAAPARACASSVALAVARARHIEQRLVAILDPRRDRRPLRWPLAGLIALVSLATWLLLVPLQVQSALEPRAAVEAADDQPAADSSAKAADDARRLAEIRLKLLQRYVKKLDDGQITDAAIQGIIDALKDPYCTYLAPDSLEEREKQLAGTLSGIGVQVRLIDNRLTVLTPLEDSPALNAGVRAGDVILAINGNSTKELDIPAAVKLILGAPGTAVKLKILHADGKEAELDIIRAKISVRPVRGFRRGADDRWEFLLDLENRIGYIQVTAFNTHTAEEMKAILKTLTDKGLKGLILDLRFCPGGLLPVALDVARMFVDKGTLITVKGQHTPEKAFVADGKSLVGEIPMIVLINGQTASAAELVAGILRDHDRALVVGTRSYGKGSVQELVRLEQGGGAILLTTAYYYLPSGRNIHKVAGAKDWGVDPSDGYYLPMTPQQLDKMQQISREQEYLGRAPKPASKSDKVSPATIEQDYADPQLAGALKSMTAKLTAGAFIKIGKSHADLLADVTRRDDLQKRRQALLKDLDKVNKELTELDK
jgi:carboxyl-terminal processing protease